MRTHVLNVLLVSMLIMGCQGKKGPMGPQGPSGPGTRIVYSGTASSDEYVVSIPELHLDDFPLIGCYYYFEDAWSELYLDYSENNETIFPYALIQEQKVTLYRLNGLQYNIVLVL